jgi:hypothetical protein
MPAKSLKTPPLKSPGEISPEEIKPLNEEKFLSLASEVRAIFIRERKRIEELEKEKPLYPSFQ